MATEQGIVSRVTEHTAWVQTSRSSACEGCASRGACHSLGGGSDDMEVEAVNTAGAAPGDTVLIRFETAPLLKASFLLYVFPILAMIVAAVIGQDMAPRLGLSPSVSAAIFAFGVLIPCFIFIRVTGDRLSKKAEYRPTVFRIRRKAPPACPSSGNPPPLTDEQEA